MNARTKRNLANNKKRVFFFIGILITGFLIILRGSISITGTIGDLRGFLIEKNSYENLFGFFFLIFSFLLVNLSFIILTESKKQKSIIPLYLQIASFFLIILAGISYFYFYHGVIDEISNNIILENISIAHSTLLGTFGFILALIFVGISISISNLKKTNDPSTN